MKLWFYKKFKKDQVVRLYLTTATNRLRIIYRIANSKTIKIGNARYELNDEDYILSKGIPSYFLVEGRIEPINPHDLNKSVMTPEYYDTAISANLAKELFNASGAGMDHVQIIMILVVIVLISSLIGNYLMYDQLQILREENLTLIDMIRSLGGRP